MSEGSPILRLTLKNVVYLSGGIKNVPNHRDLFAAAEKTLTDNGFDVVNPLRIGECSQYVPDTWKAFEECFWPGEKLPKGHTWECYMRYDLRELLLCDRIAMMAGWENSKGARLELALAKAVGIEVLFQQPDGTFK